MTYYWFLYSFLANLKFQGVLGFEFTLPIGNTAEENVPSLSASPHTVI